MLAATAATAAIAAAIVGMMMLGAMGVEMVVVMGMGMIVVMAVGVGMGMGNTVMGVLMLVGMFMVMGMTGNMIVMQMHKYRSFAVFYIITDLVYKVKYERTGRHKVPADMFIILNIRSRKTEPHRCHYP